MIFLNRAHRAFYEQAVAAEQAEDFPARKALFYCLGLTDETRVHVDELYNFCRHVTRENGLRALWHTSDSHKVCSLAFNLYNGFHGRNGTYTMDYTPWRIFDTPLQPYLLEAIKIRFPDAEPTFEQTKEESQ